MFCANHGEIMTSAPLPQLVEDFKWQDKIAACRSAYTPTPFHLVDLEHDGPVTGISDVQKSRLWMSGACCILRRDVFASIGEDDELLFDEPFGCLIADAQLLTYQYEGSG